MSETPQEKPGTAGWKVAAIGILIAVVIGLIMIAIGSAKIKRGAQMQKEAELRLQDVLVYVADDAKSEADSMDEDLRYSNWGLATKRLGRLSAAVSLMDQIAPESKRGEMNTIKDSLAQVQKAVEEHAEDWRDRLDGLRAAIDSLGEKS